MASLRWDEQSQAFTETNEAPKRYDPESDAWVETTGMSWDPEVQAWTERWNNGVKAYVYGAALETVTIKKDGIIVATVETDSTGQSTEKITLEKGTYTMTGSVSGYTEEQEVDGNTDKFRAMPKWALYWYGNECADVTGGWGADGWIYDNNKGSTFPVRSGTKNTNNIYLPGAEGIMTIAATTNMIDLSNVSGINITCSTSGVSNATNFFVIDEKNIVGGYEKVAVYTNSTKQTNTLDVSDVSSECYVVFFVNQASNRTGTMYAIWFE